MRPSDADIKKLKWLLERLESSEEFCSPYFERAKRHYKLYRFGSAVEEDQWPYVNRVRSRDILAFVEDSTAILIQTLFATMPFFSVLPRETAMMYSQYEQIDPILLGEQISKCLDYQISHEDTEFFEEMIDFIKGGTIFGNSYLGVYPKFNANGQYLRPLLKAHDYWDILPIAGARRVSKSRGIFVREFVSLEELKELDKAGIYQNVKNIKSTESSETDAEKNWHLMLLQEIGMVNFQQDDDNVEVFHYLSGGHIISFADRKIILRDSNGDAESPYPYDNPVVQYKYMPLPMEFFAMGIPEVLEVLQEDKNLIRSARRDNIDLVIQKVIKARSGADLNFDQFNYYPGAIWPMENLNDIEPLETSDVTQSSYQEEAMREHDMENALSLFGYARGQTPQHQEQPTTVMKLQQASLNRLDLAIKLAEFTTLQNIATRIILLTRQYMDLDTYEAIIGEKDAGFFKLKLEDIKRFYHFKPMGSSVTHIKELKQQQIQQAIQLLSGVPPEMMMQNITPFTVDWYEALKSALDANDVQNAEKILIKLQQQQQPQMGGQPPGPGGGMDMGGMMDLLLGGGQR